MEGVSALAKSHMALLVGYTLKDFVTGQAGIYLCSDASVAPGSSAELATRDVCQGLG